MILFLNRNDEKWPHTRQIKTAGQNHILPPLGNAWKTKHRQFPKGKIEEIVYLAWVGGSCVVRRGSCVVGRASWVVPQ